METAIKKAIEGGWKYDIRIGELAEGVPCEVFEIAWCNPLFWKALGKACGWDTCPCKSGPDGECSFNGEPWTGYWHRFIDHVAEGKDADSYFNNLLK